MRAVGKITRLLISLIVLALLPILPATADEACWLNFPDDAQKLNATQLLSSTGRLCVVEENIPYVGKTVYDGHLRCQYSSVTGLQETPYDKFFMLNASYDHLVELIADHGSAGTLHQSVRVFTRNFNLCYPSSEGHTHIVPTMPADSTALMTVSDFCLKKDKEKKAILTGSWDDTSCKIDPQMPRFSSNTSSINFSQDTSYTTNDQKPTKEPSGVFQCEGYEYVGEGWAESDILDQSLGYGFHNCEKRTPEKCCNFAIDEDCKTFSQDKSGKCCCGKRINHEDIGHGNGDNRAYKRQR